MHDWEQRLHVAESLLRPCRVGRLCNFAFAVIMALACALQTDTPADRSAHRIRFVNVAQEVRLEVLDWGGSGRPFVLLAGSGNTAHVFDDFAPKLTGCHVYGVTRRGFGASDRPASGYDDQRLADDVLEVLQSLRIRHPILVGHSMAGGELTTIGREHSVLVAGLIYLDALGDPRDWPASDPAYLELVNKLPEVRRGAPALDRSSFSAYRVSQLRAEGFTFPESELRQIFTANGDGSVGSYKGSPAYVQTAIGAGQKKRDYSNIRVPVLALFEYPQSRRPTSEAEPETDAERADRQAYATATAAYVDRWVNNLKRSVAEARIVDLPGAGHFVFLSRETAVLNAIRTFVTTIR